MNFILSKIMNRPKSAQISDNNSTDHFVDALDDPRIDLGQVAVEEVWAALVSLHSVFLCVFVAPKLKKK